MRTTFIATLSELADDDPDLWLLCGDVGFSVLEKFADRFPGRTINVGVAEQNMAGIAAGIALSGKTVFIYSIANFPTFRCLEQIRNDVCHHGADVKVVSVGGGFAYGSQGYTHHAIEDVAVMGVMPGMEVYVPSDPSEVREITRHIAGNGKPSYLRLSRSGEPILGPGGSVRPRMLREGADLVILASGPIAAACLAAADGLSAQGINAAVASVPCLKPFDEGFLWDLSGHARLIVTAEEHVGRGGLADIVAALLAASSRHPPLLPLAIPEQAGGGSIAGDRDHLIARAGLSAPAIAGRITEALGRL